ncbi:hypothetical protein B0H14DRAFT_1564439 [Mycena olivaceomarginata]|nr:hypothetical protein B0H14DRAFT_1564439 [Mycena olivaceomarginata]
MDNDWDGLWQTMILAPDPPLFPNLHFDSILWDLTMGSLRLVKQMIRGEVDTHVLGYIRVYGFFVRSCPPSPRILQDLVEIESEMESNYRQYIIISQGFHYIIRWLETFPDPPLELIGRFKNHLEAECRRNRTFPRLDYLEGQWELWKKLRNQAFSPVSRACLGIL